MRNKTYIHVLFAMENIEASVCGRCDVNYNEEFANFIKTIFEKERELIIRTTSGNVEMLDGTSVFSVEIKSVNGKPLTREKSIMLDRNLTLYNGQLDGYIVYNAFGENSGKDDCALAFGLIDVGS